MSGPLAQASCWQRCRKWKICSLTRPPTSCTCLPLSMWTPSHIMRYLLDPRTFRIFADAKASGSLLLFWQLPQTDCFGILHGQPELFQAAFGWTSQANLCSSRISVIRYAGLADTYQGIVAALTPACPCACLQVEQLIELEIVPVCNAKGLGCPSKTFLPCGWHQLLHCADGPSDDDVLQSLHDLTQAGQLLPGRVIAFEPRISFVDLQCLW